ncbi:MAG: class I SAM-dependent methyltransferase [Pirellulales bacterium]
MAQDDRDRRAVFRPDFYEVPSLEHAKMLTVTSEQGMTGAERWVLETAYVVEDIGKFFPIEAESWVLDYGCGTGRISKGLVEKHGCHAVGIDASKSMRLLAPEYVLSERFTTWSPEVLEKMIQRGFRADFCICLWVIQHAYDPMDVISRIDRALVPDGLLYALNGRWRCVPTDKGYVDDGFDMRAALAGVFSEQSFSSLPETVAPAPLARDSMIQVLRKIARS